MLFWLLVRLFWSYYALGNLLLSYSGVKLQENCQGDTEAWCETAGHSLSAGKLQEIMLTLTGPGLTVCQGNSLGVGEQAWSETAGHSLSAGETAGKHAYSERHSQSLNLKSLLYTMQAADNSPWI